MTEHQDNPWEQGFFWNNFPTKPKKNLHFTAEYASETHLRNRKEPYILYTGIQELPFYLIENNAELIDGLRKKGKLHIYLLEPVSYYFTPGEYNHGYYSEFHQQYNSDARCGEIDSISQFAKKTGIKICVHVCDYKFQEFYAKHYPELEIVCDDLFLKLHTRPPINVYFKKKLKKKFYCVNGRYTPHRHMIMSYLVDKDGYYVWRFNGNMEKVRQEMDWANDSLPWDYLIKNNETLNNSHLQLDVDFDKIDINNFQGDGMVHSVNFHSDMIHDINNSVFCYIVNETRFAQPTGNISEKTFQAVNSYTPFVLIAPPRSLEYFKRLGFKTFNKWWDESYDLEEDHSKRMNKIFDVIDFINSKNMKQLKSMYKEMKPILDYNAERMRFFRYMNLTLY